MKILECIKGSGLCVILLYCTGCVTFKPDSYSVSDADYNERKVIEHPFYKGRLTPVGYGVVAASTLLGGYAGSKVDIVSFYDGESKKNIKAADIAIGSLVGFTTSMLFNYGMGYNKANLCNDPNEWLKRANNEFLYVSGPCDRIVAMHRSAESKYQIEKTEDIIDFKLAFPKSRFDDDIVKKSLKSKSVMRDDYPMLIEKFPSSSYVNEVKKQYISKSTDLTSILQARIKYPDTGLDVEPHAALSVASCADARLYQSNFPNSKYNKFVLLKGLQYCSDTEIRSLPTLFPQDYKLSKEDMSALNADDNMMRNYLNALYVIIDAKQLSTLDLLFSKYRWLDFKNKPDFVLEKYWDMTNANFKYGDDVITAMRRLAIDDKYQYLKISTAAVNNSITKGLMNEVAKMVTIADSKIISTESSEYKKWSENNNFSAGFVSSTGEIKHIVSGLLKNNSKFDLPIMVTVSGDLIKSQKLEGTGFFSDIGAAFIGAYSGNSINNSKKLGSKSDYFQIPSMKPYSTASFAVLLDFGKGELAGGVNWGDVMKVKTETKLENTRILPIYYNLRPQEYKIQQQLEWAKLAKLGFPNAPLTDLYRKTQINNDAWVSEYQRQQEAMWKSREKRDDQGDNNNTDNNCPFYLIEDRDWENRTFLFSGHEYKPWMSNQVYKFKCKKWDNEKFLVFLDHDTKADSWPNSDWEKGWFVYEMRGFFSGDHKSSSYKTTSAAIKDECDCED